MKLCVTLCRALIVGLLMPCFICCSTYNTKLVKYYDQVHNGNYPKAIQVLNATKFMHQKRNQLLFLLEKGKMLHLMGAYDSSNTYFNQADQFIEITRKTMGDVAVANLLNPMVKTYLGDDFEPYFIHYYKALNYAYLGKWEDAIVEARRITLSTTTLSDKFANKATRYSKDAFMLNFQGMLYEANGDINNAFIAYRNAAEVYESTGGTYYGVEMPLQLKKDLINTALKMGFASDAESYITKYQLSKNEFAPSDSGELVVIIEQGWAPEKKEQNYFLAKATNGLSMFYYIDEDGNSVQVPFDLQYYRTINANKFSATDFSATRIAIPYYSPISLNKAEATISLNDKIYTPQIGENLNSIAVNVLKERKLKEITDALARQIVKKLAEKGVEAGTREISKNNNNKEKSDTQKNKDAEVAGAVAGFLVNMVNAATEKADTRSWKSLPAFISYARIPLKLGENKITITTDRASKTITIVNKGGLHLYNCSFAE